MYLADTNIFLEILLKQNKINACKNFLTKNINECIITDFTLYSIGIALFKPKLFTDYQNFYQSISKSLSIRSLPFNQNSKLVEAAEKFNLDFDDPYQYCVAKYYNATIVTMDNDFKKIDDIKVLFL